MDIIYSLISSPINTWYWNVLGRLSLHWKTSTTRIQKKVQRSDRNSKSILAFVLNFFPRHIAKSSVLPRFRMKVLETELYTSFRTAKFLSWVKLQPEGFVKYLPPLMTIIDIAAVYTVHAIPLYSTIHPLASQTLDLSNVVPRTISNEAADEKRRLV